MAVCVLRILDFFQSNMARSALGAPERVLQSAANLSKV